MAVEKVSTFCRICEPQCGLIAVVEDGQIVDVEANPNHVLSKGHFCKKARAMIDVTYDSDRVLRPLKRTGGPGEFSEISWDQAYTEIAEKLKSIRADFGSDSVSTYMGNPPYYSYAAMLWLEMFNKTLDIRWKYCVNGEDGNALLATSTILYGSAGVIPKPDLWRTDFLLIEGGNPMVSHGSSFAEPRIGSAIREIKDRGGRVIVVDPRETETARGNEYIPINAGTDAYFVSALINQVIEQELTDHQFIEKYTRDFEQLKEIVADCSPEWAEQHSGIPAETIRTLAKDFSSAKRATIHHRIGTSSQRYGTLSTMLLNTLCIITGNLDKPGGLVFGWGLMNMAKVVGTDPIGTKPSRVDKLPDVAGGLPSTALIGDIETPGEGQLKALIMLGANPCLTSPACGPRLDAALQKLDLFVSTDLYVTETNQFADYVLPAATFFEREDVPFLAMPEMLRPSMYASKAVVERRGDVKEDWEILDDICRYMGMGAALPSKPLQWLAKVGLRLKPRHIMDLIIRTSSKGDKFGLKPGGLSIKKLQKDLPNGIRLKDELPTGIFEESIMTPDKKICLANDQVVSEMKRLKADEFYQQEDYPLRLFGMRKKSTQNSWMHNVSALAKDHQQQTVLINPVDARSRDIEDGDRIQIRSPYGKIAVHAELSESVKLGNISLPHGWGKNGKMEFANSIKGANSNVIASDDPKDTDQVSAMSVLNGIPVALHSIT